MAWFFLDEPAEVAGLAVERGLLIHGGRSDSGATLDDLWLFDLTNFFTSVGPCPWVSLNASTGSAVHSGGMAWDQDNQQLVLIGGYEDDGSSIQATTTVRTVALADALNGSGFTTATTLPDVEYASAILGDRSKVLGQIVPDHCIGTPLPEVPCVMNGGAVFSMGLTGACDSSGYFKSSSVDMWGGWDPCLGEVSCTVDGYDYTPELDLWPGCQEDPQCDGDSTSGITQVEFLSESLGHIAEVGAVWDPSTGDTLAIGGTTGCTGSCPGYPTALFDLDTTGTQSLAAANKDVLVTYGATGTTTPISGTTAPSADWPAESTYGRRAAGVSAIGLGWDYDTMSPTSSGFTPVVVGGTTEQAQAPGVDHELTCGNWLCTDLCTSWESSYEPLARPHTSDLDGLVAPADMVGSVTTSGAYTPEISMTARMYVAAANMDDEAILAVGGLEANGSVSDELNVLDIAAGTNTATTGTLLGERSGAAAANDPIAKAVWVFGGQAGDSGLYRVTDSASVEPETASWLVGDYDGSFFDEGAIEVFLTHDGTDWFSGSRFDVALDCTDCWAEDLDITLGTDSLSDATQAEMSVIYSDATGDTWDLSPVLIATEGGPAVKFRLPRVVGPNHVLEVQVSMPMTPSLQDDVGDDYSLLDTFASRPGGQLGLVGSDVGTGSSVDAIWALKGIPALPENAKYDTFRVTSSIEGPAGTTAIGQGEPDGDGITFGPYDGVANWSFQALVFESLEYQAYADPIGGGARVHYWTDQLVEDDGGVLNHYVLGEHDTSASKDLDLLVSRLGPHPQGSLHVVFLRKGATSLADSIGGVTGNGLAAAFVADVDGVINDEVMLFPFHEAAHFWLGSPSYTGHRETKTTSATLVEGVPRLLEFMRDPNHTWVMRVQEGGACASDADCDAGWACDTDTCALYVEGAGAGLWHAIALGLNERDCANESTRLESDSEEFLRYWANAYVWTQLIELHRSSGNLESDFWQAIRDELAEDDDLSEASVRSIVDTRLAASGFYDEWFEDDDGALGTPLVAIRSFTVNADTGGETSRSLTVEQVQTGMYTTANSCAQSVDEFSSAPFVLGCDALGDEALQAADSDPTLAEYAAFEECQFFAAIGNGAVGTYATSGSSLTLSLTPNPNLSIDPMPARFALGASDTLLPGWEDTFAADASDWHRRCDAVTTITGDDCVDSDGDGFPNLGDCDSFDPTIHPDQPPNSDGTGVDYNCDGWVYTP